MRLVVSERRLRVGLVIEPTGIDNPYYQGAYLGLERAVRELGSARTHRTLPMIEHFVVRSRDCVDHAIYRVSRVHRYAASAQPDHAAHDWAKLTSGLTRSRQGSLRVLAAIGAYGRAVVVLAACLR